MSAIQLPPTSEPWDTLLNNGQRKSVDNQNLNSPSAGLWRRAWSVSRVLPKTAFQEVRGQRDTKNIQSCWVGSSAGFGSSVLQHLWSAPEERALWGAAVFLLLPALWWLVGWWCVKPQKSCGFYQIMIENIDHEKEKLWGCRRSWLLAMVTVVCLRTLLWSQSHQSDIILDIHTLDNIVLQVPEPFQGQQREDEKDKMKYGTQLRDFQSFPRRLRHVRRRWDIRKEKREL